MELGGLRRPGFTSACQILYFFSSVFFSSVALELLLAPELGVALESVEEPPLELVVGEVLDEDEAPLLGVVLGAALDEDEELLGGVVLGEVLDELELGELGVVTLPEAEPLAEPGARVVSLVDDPDEDEAEPEGEDGVVAPRVAPVSGPRSQP